MSKIQVFLRAFYTPALYCIENAKWLLVYVEKYSVALPYKEF